MAHVNDLLELTEEAIAYTPAYFRHKWRMDERLADLKRRLASVPADSPTLADANGSQSQTASD